MNKGVVDLLAFLVGLATFVALVSMYWILCVTVATNYEGDRVVGLPVLAFWVLNAVLVLFVFPHIAIWLGVRVQKALSA